MSSFVLACALSFENIPAGINPAGFYILIIDDREVYYG
jgi:hypothetical protein